MKSANSFANSKTSLKTYNNNDNDGQQLPSYKRALKLIKKLWLSRQIVDPNDKESIVKTTIRELAIYILFLAILCVLTFGMANPINYYYTGTLTDLFTNSATEPESGGEGVAFSGIGSMSDFWDVMQGPMLDAIYWETWYNNDNMSADLVGLIYHENKVLGLPRLRQVRVKKNSCAVNKKFAQIIPACYDAYSSFTESKEPFGVYESSERVEQMEESAFIYQSSSKLHSSNYNGVMASYGGGGFVKNFGKTRVETEEILESLKTQLWIDRGTRAIFLDLTVYNGNINMFSQIKLISEFPPTGGVLTSQSIRTVKLIRYVTSMDYFVLACEIIFIMFVLYYTVEEIMEIRIHKLSYFTSSVWNVLDVVCLLISYACIIFNFWRIVRVNEALDELLKNLDRFISFEHLCYWQTQFNNSLALMVFLSWIKIFKYISFNKTMNQLSSTLSACAKDLLGFAVMFSIVFFAFAQLGYLLFGDQVGDYSSMTTCLFILGDFDFVTLQQASPILGPVYFMAYVFFVFFVLLNMFLAIINDTYSDVKSDPNVCVDDIQLGGYFKRGYDKMLTKLNLNRDKIIDIQDTIMNADKNGDNKLNYDEIRAELKNKGYTDIEIQAFFVKYDTDGDGNLDTSEQDNVMGEMSKQTMELDKEMEQFKGEQEESEHNGLDLVQSEEFNKLSIKVESMESLITSILRKIDNVSSASSDGVHKSKSIRAEMTARLIDSIYNASFIQDDLTKRQLEKLIRNECLRVDDSVAMTRR